METAFAILLTLLYVISFIRYEQIQGKLKVVNEQYADLFSKLLTSEQLRVQIETEHKFVQASIVQMMQRPIVATMSDEQVNNITGALLTYLDATKDPTKLN